MLQIGNYLSLLVEVALPNMVTLLTLLIMLTLLTMFLLLTRLSAYTAYTDYTAFTAFTAYTACTAEWHICLHIYCSMVRAQAHDGLRVFYGIRVG